MLSNVFQPLALARQRLFSRSPMKAVRGFLLSEEGAVGIEYALLASVIALALVGGAVAIGDEYCALFQGIKTAISSGTTPVVSVPC